jgi:hypothetical protein
MSSKDAQFQPNVVEQCLQAQGRGFRLGTADSRGILVGGPTKEIGGFNVARQPQPCVDLLSRVARNIRAATSDRKVIESVMDVSHSYDERSRAIDPLHTA